MKQLNNNITGEVLRLKLPQIQLLKYSVDTDIINKGMGIIDIPELHDYIIEKAAAILGVDYSIEDIPNNWVIKTGSTGQPTAYRIQIDATIIAQELYSGTPMGVMLESMKGLKPWSVNVQGRLVQYLEELLEPQLEILRPYFDKGVKIEILEDLIETEFDTGKITVLGKIIKQVE